MPDPRSARATGRRTTTNRPMAVDTSLAVPLVLRNHEFHEPARRWRGGRRLHVCGHAWLETYAVLTRLPGSSRVAPADALALLHAHFDGLLLADEATASSAVAVLAEAAVSGGAVYDGWIALVARQHGAVLHSRDARAEITYRRLGTDVEMVA
jgi:predicted nucleic acid-binding protein